MESIEITSVSSRGQIVIPQKIREKLHIHEGEKFIVMGKQNTILLKKLEVPSFKEFDKLLKKTRDFAKKKKLSRKDVEYAVKSSRR